MQNDAYYDLGLAADLEMWKRTPIARRRILRLGVAGITTLLAGCRMAAPSGGAPAAAAAKNTPVVDANGNTCSPAQPQETAGPYPADGSNASSKTLNVLKTSGIVRSDIRTSLSTKNVAAGVPTSIELTLVNLNNKCAPLAGYALYAWHCNREGAYSMYSNGVTEEDYLRGVQVADGSGKLTFQTIFPACYVGRWPHVHFEVYPSLDTANGSGNAIFTSQLALPEDVCKTVYGSADGYTASVNNLGQLSLASDNVFSDDSAKTQLATVTGSVKDGYVVKLTIGVAA